jgi:predicted Zn-dependent protease
MTRRIVTAVLISAFIVSCATSPLGRRQLALLPDNQMAMMGVQAFDNFKSKLPVDSDSRVNAYVDCVAGSITREVGGTWEIVVFKDASPNAFALPGGKIGVHSGLLKVARNSHQLATVLAHEVAHVLAHHANERVSQQLAVQQGLNLLQVIANPTSAGGQTLMGLLGVGAQFGVLLPYSRLQESEADLYGLDLMARAGFDPQESVQLWRNMEQAGGQRPVEFLSTHPSHETRMRDLQNRIPAALTIRQQALAQGKNSRCGD